MTSGKNSFSAVSRLSPTHQVQSQLFAAIQKGEYPPGTILPSERRLCEMFGVSRVSIREALAGLSATGLIDIQQGKGAFVRQPVKDEFSGPFGLYIERHKGELAELLRIRGALDGMAASDAAEYATKAQVAKVEKAHIAFAEAVENDASPQELATLDIALHHSIAACGKGTLLPTLLEELNSLLVESRHILFAREGQPQRSVADHEQILAHIKAKDAAAAQQMAIDHVNKMWSWIQDFTSTKLPS